METHARLHGLDVSQVRHRARRARHHPEPRRSNDTLGARPSTTHGHISSSFSPPRIMRVLVNSGFFSIKGNESDASNEEEVYYDLTATSKLLVTGSTNSLAPLVLFVTGLDVGMAGLAMSTWIKASDDDDKNETPFHVAHDGKGLFEFASERPEFNALFNEAMACDNRVLIGEMVKNWGDVLFGGLRSLVDVGGGTGLAAEVIVGAFPEMKCSVLELDHVVDVQPENELVEFVRGDMFVQIPQADAFLLKWVLHDWNDKDCVKI